VVHVTDVSVVFSVAVVVLDDRVEKLGESGVGVVTARVHSDTGVHVLGARENHLFEWNTGGIFLSSILGEDLRSKESTQRRFGACRELDGPSKLVDGSKMRTSFHWSSKTIRWLQWLKRSLLSLQLLLSANHGLHTIVHVLNQIDLGSTEPSQV